MKMRANYSTILGVTTVTTIMSCTTAKKEYMSYELCPVRTGSPIEMEYTPKATKFILRSSTADEVRLMLYEAGEGRHTYEMVEMQSGEEGTWIAVVSKDLIGKFYTLNVKIDDKQQGDTPGINARAVGVNGKRAAIIDWQSINPDGWESDTRPPLKPPIDVIIHKMHHRDFSVDPISGAKNRGRYLVPTEHGAMNPDRLLTGIDHPIELGVVHVHLFLSSDYASVDGTRLNENSYNWGYDPQNYSVPDGSYATDPYQPVTRMKEFKQMVQALHRAGIRVIVDVVYNHTLNTDESNFERAVPGYFYRQKEDKTLANGSGCGNEIASERLMMRKFMVESVSYWIRKYHVDGLRFDLMGTHDIETMNEIRKAVNMVDPTICIYGGGWAAEAPQYPADPLATKGNIAQIPGVAVLSDKLCDGLHEPVGDKRKRAFLARIPGGETSVKFGIAGATEYPQVQCDSINYIQKPWAKQPVQMISYVSCHDGLCLVDRLKVSVPDVTPEQLIRPDRLAQTVVFTSQGIPLIYAEGEIIRDKQGVDNSYKSPDAVNAIDWRRKTISVDASMYYKRLIDLCKSHPALRMGDAGQVRKHPEFFPVKGSNLIVFRLKGHANGDHWEDIIAAFNSHSTSARLIILVGEYIVVCEDGMIDVRGLGIQDGSEVIIPGQLALILCK